MLPSRSLKQLETEAVVVSKKKKKKNTRKGVKTLTVGLKAGRDIAKLAILDLFKNQHVKSMACETGLFRRD
mgnify:CR=1 FL=1